MDNIGIAYNADKCWSVANVTSGGCYGGCGSGNFLYVTLEHMKRLEGEVLNLLHDLGETQGLLEMQGITVDPHQFLGLEINPRAARIAEMVLWIGYLQWHFRTHGKVNPPEPVLRDFHNIENRDALITYDERQVIIDTSGIPQTRWDGFTYKPSPITGEPIPDESARIEQYCYVNPQKAIWPTAEYIVGNPPFIGNKRMRAALGDGYVDAVRGVWRDVPDTSDFVMYWWHNSAELIKANELKRFGFITTNSLKQIFNRKVLERHLTTKNPISLAFAVPDHPWVDAGDGAQVRISMTVGAPIGEQGVLSQVIDEREGADDEIEVRFASRTGEIHPDLSVGAAVSRANTLTANTGMCFQGMNLVGKGFRVTSGEITKLGYDVNKLPEVIKPHFNARDLMQNGDACWVIDLYGLTAEEAENQYPSLYNRLLTRVKPERDQNNRESRRRNWWLFGEPVGRLRKAWAGLNRVILTPETAKHRVFVFEPMPFCPDHKLYAIASESAFVLGVLSSRLHALWALVAGGRMGVGNDPVFNNTRCFSTFPFPDVNSDQKDKIRDLAERLDAHRKRQQDQYSDLTLTGMYNVIEKLRSGDSLSAKEKVIHDNGLVSILRELHDELDRAVFAAYGCDDIAEQLVGLPGATTPLPNKSEDQSAAEQELLQRLVGLNTKRAAEEANGHVHWLRPEYQNPRAKATQKQAEMVVDSEAKEALPVSKSKKLKWPKLMREQVVAVRSALETGDLTLEAIAQKFSRNPEKHVATVLGALKDLGMVEEVKGLYSLKL